MPYQLDLDADNRVVRVRLYGLITDADLLAADDELRADTRFDSGFDQFVDVSEASQEQISADVLRRIASRPPLFGPGSRRAFVVRSDLGYGLARLFQARRGDVAGEIQIFRSRAHAELWLGKAAGAELKRVRTDPGGQGQTSG